MKRVEVSMSYSVDGEGDDLTCSKGNCKVKGNGKEIQTALMFLLDAVAKRNKLTVSELVQGLLFSKKHGHLLFRFEQQDGIIEKITEVKKA